MILKGDIAMKDNKFRQMIKDSGYSYRELEKMTGISYSAISRYANGDIGKIPITVVEKICRALLVDPSIFFLEAEEEDTTANSTLSPERAEMKNKIDNMSDEDFDRFTQALRLIFPDKF